MEEGTGVRAGITNHELDLLQDANDRDWMSRRTVRTGESPVRTDDQALSPDEVLPWKYEEIEEVLQPGDNLSDKTLQEWLPDLQ